LQFHYTAWPDFGVPESPTAFLEFLFAIRREKVLDDVDSPPVIHCSAGIGRSGTICLVDTCLKLVCVTEFVCLCSFLQPAVCYR
jgi:protein tyrosine phosphatase